MGKFFNLIDILDNEIPIVGDGPSKLLLRRYGFPKNKPEILANYLSPQLVKRMHFAYLQNGSKLIRTNSITPTKASWSDKYNIESLFNSSVSLAKESSKGKAIVAANMTEAPLTWNFESRYKFYAEQSIYLSDTHSDLFWLDNFKNFNEIILALKAIEKTNYLQKIVHIEINSRSKVSNVIDRLSKLLNSGATFVGISIKSDIKLIEHFIPSIIEKFGIISLILELNVDKNNFVKLLEKIKSYELSLISGGSGFLPSFTKLFNVLRV